MTLDTMPMCNQEFAEVNADWDTDKVMVCIKLLI